MVFNNFKKSFTYFLILAGLVSFTGCTQTISIDGFDKDAWNLDKNGCEGTRDKLSFVVFSNKQKLFDTNQRAIKKLLGSPNKTQLYSRNQQFFVYYISNGSQCNAEEENEGATLNIRFGALNKVNEVFIIE